MGEQISSYKMERNSSKDRSRLIYKHLKTAYSRHLLAAETATVSIFLCGCFLPASLPNPLKHHVCSIEISPPTPAAAGFFPLPAPHLSVCGWLMVFFISSHFLQPIRMCHLLAVDLGQIWSSFLLTYSKTADAEHKKTVSVQILKGNRFLLSNEGKC